MNYELQEKLEQEIKELVQKLLKLEPKMILDRAYEYVSKIHIKDEILDRNLDSEEMKALLKTDNVLQICFDSWLEEDSSLCEMYETSIEDTLDELVEDYKKNKTNSRER